MEGEAEVAGCAAGIVRGLGRGGGGELDGYGLCGGGEGVRAVDGREDTGSVIRGSIGAYAFDREGGWRGRSVCGCGNDGIWRVRRRGEGGDGFFNAGLVVVLGGASVRDGFWLQLSNIDIRLRLHCYRFLLLSFELVCAVRPFLGPERPACTEPY